VVRAAQSGSGPAAFSLFQSATFAPDAASRWMGSIAMDKVGNIAVGYSVSSSAMHPANPLCGASPHGSARHAVDRGQHQGGAGSQLASLDRWGDYSAMTIDPVDDCTFFYTNEYLRPTARFNWSTQIASFKIAGCQ